MSNVLNKEEAIERLRSIALHAHDAIKALRESNYDTAQELTGDIADDCEAVQAYLTGED